jgi:rhamnose utilization protein RhaD (predicted bifunctional aldolase and dehydrogenase)
LDRRLESSLPRLARATASIVVIGAPLKTATDRAVEAVEAAEKIFADEIGGTLGLSPAAKIALVATITAAIEAAVAEERQQLTWVL